jgi:glycerol uptake facilitator protein
MGNPYLGEFLGTMILILLGDGVVANVVLSKTKGSGGGWIVITAGWAFAVVFGVATAIMAGSPYAHINPAVTIAFALLSAMGKAKFDLALVPGFIICQILGAFVGAVLVFLAYYQHFKETPDPTPKLGVFSTIPQIKHYGLNILTEIIGTFMLLVGVFAVGVAGLAQTIGGAVAVGFLVWGIGLSLGGPTGYAINPARDLGPRIAHAVLPIPGKGSSQWDYGLTVPIIGPIIGGIVAALIYAAII